MYNARRRPSHDLNRSRMSSGSVSKIAVFDLQEFCARGMGSGFLIEAAIRGIPFREAMERSRRRSVQHASRYYNNATRNNARAPFPLGRLVPFDVSRHAVSESIAEQSLFAVAKFRKV